MEDMLTGNVYLRQSGTQDHGGKEGSGKDTKTTETAKKSGEKVQKWGESKPASPGSDGHSQSTEW